MGATSLVDDSDDDITLKCMCMPVCREGGSLWIDCMRTGRPELADHGDVSRESSGGVAFV